MAFNFKKVTESVKNIIGPKLTAVASGSNEPSTGGWQSADVKKDLAAVEPTVKPTIRYSNLTANDVAKYGIGMPSEEDKTGNLMDFKKGGSVSSASKRADGCAQRGKTRGKMV